MFNQVKILVIQSMIWMSTNPSLLGYPKFCMRWEKNCPSTHQGLSNCWRVAMISPFLWICKVHIKLITTTLYMVLGRLLYLCLMLEPNHPFCGNHFMISKSNIDAANLGLFILSHVPVPPKHSIKLMSFCGPIYCHSNYLNIVKYKHNISMYSMRMNGYASRKFNRNNMLYIDGRPHTHGNIAGLINSSRCSLFSANCSLRNTSIIMSSLWKGKHPYLLLYMQYIVCLLVTSC